VYVLIVAKCLLFDTCYTISSKRGGVQQLIICTVTLIFLIVVIVLFVFIHGKVKVNLPFSVHKTNLLTLLQKPRVLSKKVTRCFEESHASLYQKSRYTFMKVTRDFY